MEAEAFKSQIELSASLARSQVASWLSAPAKTGGSKNDASTQSDVGPQLKGRPARLGIGATPSAHTGQRGSAATESASEKHLKKSMKRTSDSVKDASVDDGAGKGKDKNDKDRSDRTNAEDSRTTSAPSGSAKRKNVSSLNDFLDRGKKKAKKGAKPGNP